jgi:hypothetical protein
VRGGPSLGKVEEYFLETLVQGDTFLFAGKVLRFEGIRENECLVSNAFSMDAEGARLCRRQVPALDLSRRPGARDAGRSGTLVSPARPGA